MKLRYLFLLFAFCFNSAWADFSDTIYKTHPLYIEANEPFIVELIGDWPSECHPGEQKPVISEYTGDTALVEFETIVEHVTCNDVVTPYRVLIDMSDVVGTLEGEFPFVDITVRFGGFEFEVDVPHPCIHLCSPVPPPWDVKPETGLYYSDDLDKQGMLLARQNQRMAIDVLSYDESGSSEWLFGAGGIVEDAFFVELYESKGGQCLGCPAPAEPPELEAVGKLTMLMDSEGVVQVKVNDGLFVPYKQLEFGYGSREIGGNPAHKIPDLSGRWAFVEDFEWSPLNEESGSVLGLIPLVFDIELTSVTVIDPPAAPIPQPPGSAVFALNDIAGNELAQMKCDFDSTWGYPDALPDTQVTCSIFGADFNEGATIFEVTMLSLERLKFGYVGPVLSSGSSPRPIAVRID